MNTNNNEYKPEMKMSSASRDRPSAYERRDTDDTDEFVRGLNHRKLPACSERQMHPSGSVQVDEIDPTAEDGSEESEVRCFVRGSDKRWY